MADRCVHECLSISGGVLRCQLESGHTLPHHAQLGERVGVSWVTSQWRTPMGAEPVRQWCEPEAGDD